MSEYSDDERSSPDPHRFDEELMPEVMGARPKESDGVDSVVVVDNVPSVGPEKAEKLKKVLRKVFEKVRLLSTLLMGDLPCSAIFYSKVIWSLFSSWVLIDFS